MLIAQIDLVSHTGITHEDYRVTVDWAKMVLTVLRVETTNKETRR
jgi:hypothetical protein